MKHFILILACLLTACGTDETDTAPMCEFTGYSLIPIAGSVEIDGKTYIPCDVESES